MRWNTRLCLFSSSIVFRWCVYVLCVRIEILFFCLIIDQILVESALTAFYYYYYYHHRHWLNNNKLVPKIVHVIYMRYGCLHFVVNQKTKYYTLKIEQQLQRPRKTEETNDLLLSKMNEHAAIMIYFCLCFSPLVWFTQSVNRCTIASIDFVITGFVEQQN